LAYADYLASPALYDTGDFLKPGHDRLQPRVVPDLVLTDPVLADRQAEYQRLFREQFGPRGPERLPYERYIERRHRPDPEDLDFCRRHGFFRMPIGQELGGEGRLKIDYYLLTTTAQRLADVAISLTIQANTSIGTTPILLARDVDLPKARKELDDFLNNRSGHGELQTALEKLVAMSRRWPVERLRARFHALEKLLPNAGLRGPAMRIVAEPFQKCWQQASQALDGDDLSGVQNRLNELSEQWRTLDVRAREYQAELGRRLEACEASLRWIASGQISAFALTEPAAGSDTARVATRAHLRSVSVEVQPDGVLRFFPPGLDEPRYLIDLGRIEFHVDGVSYRWSETDAPVPIRFDEYDYETDDPAKMRYYEHGSRRVYFTDMAQLRKRDGRLWYDYWELSGAKMWITNGRMAGLFCLYAKTPEGVTGLVVDRHAEGLVVGKDEAKMGQNGSPTNELSLQRVRVPRENVLGLEGRGQVNALETLNVGRAGLAMSAVAQIADLVERIKGYVKASFGETPGWAAWRLERMKENVFLGESVAYEVVGRFDHPQTKSVRLESAIVKILAGELLHETIELAEEIHGLPGQSETYLVEKRKRDARVLNIYEGTNEVLRFSILKELVDVAERWSPGVSQGFGNRLGREMLELESLVTQVRQRVLEARQAFGQDLWQNANLQANCFLLADAVVWLKAADSVLGRLAWLDRWSQAEEWPEPTDETRVGRQALGRALAETRHFLHRFEEELAHLRRGYYPPAIRAASLLLDRPSAVVKPPLPASEIGAPFSILVVIEPEPILAPDPQIRDGRLIEPYRGLNPADRSALETALQLRDQSTSGVTIAVAAVGTRGMSRALREALALGADKATLVVADSDLAAPGRGAAAALALALAKHPHFDLVLGGMENPNCEEGMLARLTAEFLGIRFAGDAADIAVRESANARAVSLLAQDGTVLRTASSPACILLQPGKSLRPFAVSGFLSSLAKTIEFERWPKKAESPRIQWRPGSTGGAEETQGSPQPITPQEAAAEVLSRLGLDAQPGSPAKHFAGVIEESAVPQLGMGCVLAVLASDPHGRLPREADAFLSMAGRIAESESAELRILLFAPQEEELQRRVAGEMVGQGVTKATLVPLPESALLPETWAHVLEQLLPRLAGRPIAVVGEPWAEQAFLTAGRATDSSIFEFRVSRMDEDEEALFLNTSRLGSKVAARRRFPSSRDGTCWISIAPEAEAIVRPATTNAMRVERWHLDGQAPLEPRWNGSVVRKNDETGSALPEADFIIDVGFGIGNRDGYEALIEPVARALTDLGVRSLAIGGSRKVTEELHLLAADQQIGQSGVNVSPQVLLAIGISGAPQHLQYISRRTTIFAFNQDPEAPIMTLNKRQPTPRVYPIVGDIFKTVPAFLEGLKSKST
jgi:alkylation response protein AidB-like acyl-CoA dehydrogenase/electron transfer flavoprotein alpha subunit